MPGAVCVATQSVHVNACWTGARPLNERSRGDHVCPRVGVQLRPGQVLHLTEGLLHAVKALEPTTLSVTLLLH